MKTLLLFALLFSNMITSAQTNISEDNCKAAFKYELNDKLMSPIAATAINFYDHSTGNVKNWFWDLGDGNTSTEQNPMHLFLHPLGGPNVKMSPYRTVTLTILTSDSCKSMYAETINIMEGVTYPENECLAGFKYYQTNYDSIAKTATFQFVNGSVGDSLQYEWNFTDGNTSNVKEPTVTFDLSQNERKVCLTVRRSNDCNSEFCDAVYIYNPDKPIDPIDPKPVEPVECETTFGYLVNYDIKTFAPALVLDFYSKASPEAVKWNWKFGDGTTSEEANPTHIFNYPLGKDSLLYDLNPLKEVCLTVETTTGCSVTYCQYINIYMDTMVIDPTPVECETSFRHSVNYDIKTFAPALVLDFYSKASPEAVKWNWNFDDGTTSEEANPTHIFNLYKDSVMGFQSKLRKVCLTVETVTGCLASYCETIDIYIDTIPVDTVKQCHAWIKYYLESDLVTIPEVVAYRLVDASEGKVVSRLWTFEDGTTSTEAELTRTFDIFKPKHSICLSIKTEDGCVNEWCETIYIPGIVPSDSGYVPPASNVYTIRFESSYPPYMSSCVGWAKAQVYMNDSLVNAANYWWSNATEGQEVNGLCPTQLYTVKAIAPDGTYVSGTFLFNSDGTVTDSPFNWWVTGGRDNEFIQYDLDSKDYTVEWRLCNGEIVLSDSIPLNSTNCGDNELNMILKDTDGKVVYSENISMKALTTGMNPTKTNTSVKLYPNPVKDVLTIQYSGSPLSELQLEICDLNGRSISVQKFYDLESGQQISMNVNSLSKGVYLCKMISGKQLIRTEKFSK